MMTDAQALLTRIETVNPVDTNSLDTLDVQVWCYIHETDESDPNHQQPTRSRDDLKAIRPAGLLVRIENWETFTSVLGCFILNGGRVVEFESGKGSTEELAELHVIIQAIAYRRANPSAS